MDKPGGQAGEDVKLTGLAPDLGSLAFDAINGKSRVARQNKQASVDSISGEVGVLYERYREGRLHLRIGTGVVGFKEREFLLSAVPSVDGAEVPYLASSHYQTPTARRRGCELPVDFVIPKVVQSPQGVIPSVLVGLDRIDDEIPDLVEARGWRFPVKISSGIACVYAEGELGAAWFADAGDIDCRIKDRVIQGGTDFVHNVKSDAADCERNGLKDAELEDRLASSRIDIGEWALTISPSVVGNRCVQLYQVLICSR